MIGVIAARTMLKNWDPSRSRLSNSLGPGWYLTFDEDGNIECIYPCETCYCLSFCEKGLRRTGKKVGR